MFLSYVIPKLSSFSQDLVDEKSFLFFCLMTSTHIFIITVINIVKIIIEF